MFITAIKTTSSYSIGHRSYPIYYRIGGRFGMEHLGNLCRQVQRAHPYRLHPGDCAHGPALLRTWRDLCCAWPYRAGCLGRLPVQYGQAQGAVAHECSLDEYHPRVYHDDRHRLLIVCRHRGALGCQHPDGPELTGAE